MIVIDSSVWIDFYNNVASRTVEALEGAIHQRQVIVGDLIIAEVLQGFRDPRSIATVRDDLFAFRVVTILSPEIAVEAAVHYRALRAAGITVRKTVDALIATRCISEGWQLLYDDRDFDPFVEHLGLQPALAA